MRDNSNLRNQNKGNAKKIVLEEKRSGKQIIFLNCCILSKSIGTL